MTETSPSSAWLVWMLTHRLLLFAAVQGAMALAMALLGVPDAFARSAAWWPVSATVVSLISIAFVRASLRREGHRYRDMFRFERATFRADLLVAVGLLVAALVLAMAPNLGLAVVLWGSADAPLALFVRPLPEAVAWATLLAFPVAIGASELPTYFGYVMPRLRAFVGRTPGILLCALMLSLQHMTLPLVLDLRFVTWRALMFLPFAIVLALALHRRPRLLPYLVVAHVLLDAVVAIQVLQASVD